MTTPYLTEPRYLALAMDAIRRFLGCPHIHTSRVFTDAATGELYTVCFDCTARLAAVADLRDLRKPPEPPATGIERVLGSR